LFCGYNLGSEEGTIPVFLIILAFIAFALTASAVMLVNHSTAGFADKPPSLCQQKSIHILFRVISVLHQIYAIILLIPPVKALNP
jgi:hypothetical protein